MIKINALIDGLKYLKTNKMKRERLDCPYDFTSRCTMGRCDCKPKEEPKPHSFCETPEEKCTMNYCDENGCQNRKRELVEPKQETIREVVQRYYEDNIDDSNIPREYYEWEIQDLMIGFAYQWEQEQNDTSKVTRVEVIQHSPPYNGRAYTNYFAKDVEIQFQDDGKTLKIFLK